MLQKDVAIPGEMDISSFPFKEGDSQLFFQTPDGSGKGRLGDMEGLRCFGEMLHFAAFRKYSREVKFNFMAAS